MLDEEKVSVIMIRAAAIAAAPGGEGNMCVFRLNICTCDMPFDWILGRLTSATLHANSPPSASD